MRLPDAIKNYVKKSFFYIAREDNLACKPFMDPKLTAVVESQVLREDRNVEDAIGAIIFKMKTPGC